MNIHPIDTYVATIREDFKNKDIGNLIEEFKQLTTTRPDIIFAEKKVRDRLAKINSILEREIVSHISFEGIDIYPLNWLPCIEGGKKYLFIISDNLPPMEDTAPPL